MIRDLAQGLLLFLIRAYQALLSPLFYGSCRFHPSCSHYAAEAVEIHGPVKGAWLALGRLLRCQPFCRGGFDPVPEPDAGEFRFFQSVSSLNFLMANSGLSLGRSETKRCQEPEEARLVASRRKATKQRVGRSPTPQSGEHSDA